MALIKNKDIKNMSQKEIEEKIKDLKLELIKNKTADKNKLKPKEIKKAIARLITFNRQREKPKLVKGLQKANKQKKKPIETKEK